MKTYDELVSLFEEANLAFLQGEHSLFRTEVAERRKMTLIRDITRMWSITEMRVVSRPFEKPSEGSKKK